MRNASAEGTQRGRPRDPAADLAILDAAVRLLVRAGYASMSMEGVAAEAGVGKATVYRRYRDKADLATAAIANLKDQDGPPAETGDARADLVEHLRAFQRRMESLAAIGELAAPGMHMIGTLLVEEDHNPELIRLFRERVIAPPASAARARLEGARGRGEIRPDADLALVQEMLIGSYYARYLKQGRAPGPEWPEAAVAAVWPALVPPG